MTIKLRKRKTDKKVEWSSDTVDNEHMGRRSSKCEYMSGFHCLIRTLKMSLKDLTKSEIRRLLCLREAQTVRRVLHRERRRGRGRMRERTLHPRPWERTRTERRRGWWHHYAPQIRRSKPSLIRRPGVKKEKCEADMFIILHPATHVEIKLLRCCVSNCHSIQSESF